MNQQETFSGQTFTTPVYVNGNLETNPQITIARIPYLLERYDFDKIIKGESLWLIMTQALLGSTLGLLVNMAAKLIGSKMNSKIVFDAWEVYAFFVSALLMLICYVFNAFIPNEKRRIVNKISEHFKNA